jgi:formate dehydrogenase major subunit
VTVLTGHDRLTYERDPETMKVAQPPRYAEPEHHEGDELV